MKFFISACAILLDLSNIIQIPATAACKEHLKSNDVHAQSSTSSLEDYQRVCVNLSLAQEALSEKHNKATVGALKKSIKELRKVNGITKEVVTSLSTDIKGIIKLVQKGELDSASDSLNQLLNGICASEG